MKALTINRLALAGLRANRRDYRQMAVGIFLAVFLAVGTALGIWAMWEKKVETKLLRFGQADGFLFGALRLEPEALENTGLISKIGTVSVLGTVDGHPFGYYDQEAEDLLHACFPASSLLGVDALGSTYVPERTVSSAPSRTVSWSPRSTTFWARITTAWSTTPPTSGISAGAIPPKSCSWGACP